MSGFDPSFQASGANHRGGSVPDPGGIAGTSKFLREDATWQTVGSGSSLSVTDGVTTVNSVTQVTLSGGTVSGTSPDAVLNIPPSDPLWELEGTGGGNTIDFSFSGTTYSAARHLRVEGAIRCAQTTGSAGLQWSARVNGVGTGGYVFTEQFMQPGDASVHVYSNTGQQQWPLGGGESAGDGGAATDANTHHFLAFTMDIPYFSLGVGYPTMVFHAAGCGNIGQNQVSVGGQAQDSSLAGAVVDRLTFLMSGGQSFHADSHITVKGIR